MLSLKKIDYPDGVAGEHCLHIRKIIHRQEQPTGEVSSTYWLVICTALILSYNIAAATQDVHSTANTLLEYHTGYCLQQWVSHTSYIA